MLFTKTLFVAIFGLSAAVLALPTEQAVNNVADGCWDASRRQYGACERGREEKKEGLREEHRGERELQHGNIGAGLADILQGSANSQQGQARECRHDGRC